jgi:hypothetical protein
MPRDNHRLKENPAALPSSEEPFNKHLPHLVHNLRVYAAWLFEFLRELYGEGVSLEADLALFTHPEFAVHLIYDILGEGVIQIILE